MPRYDNVTRGDFLTERQIEKENKNIYNDSLMVAPTRLVDAEGKPLFRVIAPYDAEIEAQKIISDAHHVIHQGKMYYSKIVMEIPQGQKNFTYAITPPDCRVHMKVRDTKVSSANGANQPVRIRTRVYEDSVAAGGTPIEIFNRDRNSPNEANFQHFFLGTTEPETLGTDINLGNFMTAEVGATQSAAVDEEYIMKSGTIYVLEVENRSSNVAARVQITWNFYETRC